tara:strand:+ start:2819 stop:3964 length:1146 start_codon:yes stop_codon:yes gene_type:complete
MKTYNVIDGYFSKYIHKYFKNKPEWTNSKSKNTTLFHTINPKTKCKKCDIYNHLNDVSSIGNKRKLFQNIENIYGYKPTYLPYTIFFKKSNFDKNRITNELKQFKYWIIKPEYSLRQKGIKIIQNINDIEKALENSKYQSWILQRYIHKPFLYKNKKTHLRVYLYITVENDTVSGYLYDKGYLYVADYKYNLNDLRSGTQLTTSCNNIEYPYILNKLFGYNSYYTIFYPQIKKIAADIVKATYKYLNCSSKLCYNLIALDVIIDKYNKIYLMEANARIIGMAEDDKPGNCLSKNPSLQTPRFKSDLITNLLDAILYKKKNQLQKIIKINKSTNNIKRFKTRHYKQNKICKSKKGCGSGVCNIWPVALILIVIIMVLKKKLN